MLGLERAVDIFGEAGPHHANHEGERHGDAHELEAFLIDGGDGNAGGVDDLDHAHLAGLADPGRPELLLDHGGQAAVRVDVGGQTSKLQLVLGHRGKVLLEARDLFPKGRFLTGERGDRSVQRGHHLRKGLTVLLGHRRVSREIGSRGVLHRVSQLPLDFGDLLAEQSHARVLVGEPRP